MTTRRHLQDLPDAWATPILSLLELTRTAAHPTTSTRHPGRWPRPGRRGSTPATGPLDGPHQLASTPPHALRVQALYAAAGDDNPAILALAGTIAPLSSWDWDERTRAALDLRATFKDAPQQPIGVLVGPALPWASGVAEVDWASGFGGQLRVGGHLPAAVPRQGASQ